MSEAAEQPETPPQTPDQRKGAFISGGTFYGDVVGYQGINLPPPPPPMPLDQGYALLAVLPLDDIPAPQTLPQPHRMPFARNPLFVGRTDKLCAIAAQLKAGGTIAVTTGIGGVGKTQLAIEAVHRYGRHFGGGVFWLSFADPGAIATEVADCGWRIGAFHKAEQLDLETQVQRTLAHWASDLPRLLIFDNCEDESLLRQWRPKTGACRVLVTSRKQTSWSPDLGVKLLPLEVLTREESVRLLQQLAPRLSSEEAGQIAEELGDLPLALHLAGCYLAFYDDITSQTYLTKLYAINPLTHWSMQGDGTEGMPTDREPHVERVFALSFERLNPEVPTDALAQALLARAACFAPGEPFARAWLAATVEVSGDEEEQSHARGGAVKRLISLGLLEPVGAGELRLHRLLVAYAAIAISDATALPAVEQVVGELADQANATKVPQAIQPVLAHLRHLLQGSEEREDRTVAQLLNELGYYLTMVGSYTEARPLYERALAVTERVLGTEHPDTASILNNLALLLKTQGIYTKARLLNERVLAIREQVLGADHPYTAQSLNNLGELHRVLGAYEQAKPLYERALTIYERVLGANHPETALSLNNLALLLQDQGAYVEARPLFERALAIREQVLGAYHPDVAGNLNNLAGLLEAQGAYTEARPLYERALAIRERVLGGDHRDTAESLNNLASLLKVLGLFTEALPLLERALITHEQALGAEHPSTASSLNNLAALLADLGNYERALPLLERALAIRERELGSDHPDTAASLNNLAMWHANQGNFAPALPLLERAITIWQMRLGLQHSTTLQAQQSLAELHRRKVLAALPKEMRAALEAQDNAALRQAFQALPPEEQQAVVAQLQAVGILDDPLEQFRPLLQAIAAVAQGNDASRLQVEADLAQLETQGYHLTTPVYAIWVGQRDSAVLTVGLDATDAALVQRVLALLEEAEAGG